MHDRGAITRGGLRVTPRYPHPIRIQENTPSQATDGQLVESWTTYWNGWGLVQDEDGEEEPGDPIEGIVTTHIEMPFPRTGRIPQPTDRVLYGENKVTRTFNIDGVKRIGTARRKLMLIASEVQSS